MSILKFYNSDSTESTISAEMPIVDSIPISENL